MVRQTPLFHMCVHVLLAPPNVLGAWCNTKGKSTALLLQRETIIQRFHLLGLINSCIFLFSVAMEKNRVTKFQSLMSVIDQSGGFYHIPVDRPFCSHVNIPFRIAVAGEMNSDLEAKFLAEAAELGLVQLKVSNLLFI